MIPPRLSEPNAGLGDVSAPLPASAGAVDGDDPTVAEPGGEAVAIPEAEGEALRVSTGLGIGVATGVGRAVGTGVGGGAGRLTWTWEGVTLVNVTFCWPAPEPLLAANE